MNKSDESIIIPHRDSSIPANYNPVVPKDSQLEMAEKMFGHVVSIKSKQETGSK